MADTPSVAEEMRLSDPTTKNLNEDRPILLQQKCRPMTLASGSIGFMRIFAEVPWGESVKRQCGCRQRQFSAFSLVIFSEALDMKRTLLSQRYYIAIRSLSPAFQSSQNA